MINGVQTNKKINFYLFINSIKFNQQHGPFFKLNS